MAERSNKIDIDEDEDAAETALLAAAVAVARASELKVPHEEMQAWLLKLAEGDFAATPPEPHLPSALPGLVPGIHGATVQPPNGCQTSPQ
jgi:hypothetical protein